MEGKGKRKRTAADEAENSLGPGQEQPLEEEKTEKNIDGKDKRYHKKVKFVSTIREKFCEQPKIINEFEIFLEKLKKSFAESSKFTLKVDKAICGEPKITKKLEAKYEKRIENSSKNDGIDELLDDDTYHTLCDLLMWTRYLAERGTPSEPPNAAAGSSGSPHNEENWLRSDSDGGVETVACPLISTREQDLRRLCPKESAMGFGLLWHLHVFGVLRQAPWSRRLYFFRQVCYHGLLVSMEVKQEDQVALAVAAHEGDEVVPGVWNGFSGWRGSNESNGFGRANSQNGPKHALGPFLSSGLVEPVQPIGPDRILKQWCTCTHTLVMNNEASLSTSLLDAQRSTILIKSITCEAKT